MVAVTLFTGCMFNSQVQPRKVAGNFNINKFSGTWHEIANLKNDENLTNITLNFSVDEEKIKIVKSALNQNNEFEKVEYKAKLGVDQNKTVISYSKLGFIYNNHAYVIRNDGYKYAMIYGKEDELYILSRSKTIPEALKVIYLSYAQRDGYDTDKLIWVEQR